MGVLSAFPISSLFSSLLFSWYQPLPLPNCLTSQSYQANARCTYQLIPSERQSFLTIIVLNYPPRRIKSTITTSNFENWLCGLLEKNYINVDVLKNKNKTNKKRWNILLSILQSRREEQEKKSSNLSYYLSNFNRHQLCFSWILQLNIQWLLKLLDLYMHAACLEIILS